MHVIGSLFCAAFVWGTATISQAELAASATDFKANSDESFAPRTWTNKTGTRTAQATLLEVRDGKARLHKSNGKFAIVAVSELSETDQTYLARLKTPRRHVVHRPIERTAPADGLLTNGKLPSMSGFLNRLKLPTSASQSPDQQVHANAPTFPLLAPAPGVMPADLVHIRISLRLLEQNIEQSVVRDHEIVDTILGTSIRGQARTVATTALSLQSNPNQAVFDVVFSGAVNSRTRGENGPVVLHGWAKTPFRATKQLTLTANGMRSTATVTQAVTNSVTTNIDTTLPGLRGRFAERIAWRRSAELRPEADAIASQHAAERIRAEFDKEVQLTIARMERVLLEGTRDLHLDVEGGTPVIRFSSTPRHVDIVLHRPHATAAELALAPPAIEGDPTLAVRAHRVVVRQALTNNALKQMVQTLVSGKKSDEKTRTVKTAAPEAIGYEMRWSADRNWLILDHLDSQSPLKELRTVRVPVAQASPQVLPTAP